MRIHHIAIAVKDLDAALSFYRDALGIEVGKQREVPAEGVRIAFLPMGDSELELIEPLDPANSVGRYLKKRGEGIHHVCILVDDIAAAVARIELQGEHMATEVRSHPDGTQYAFVHPKSTCGVLMELYEKPQP